MAFDAGAIVARIKATADGIKAGINEAKAELDGFQLKAKAVGAGLTSVGGTLTKTVTLPVVAIGTAAFTAANEVDKAHKTIRAGTGATGESLEALKKDFEAVFVGVPQSAEVVSSALADLNTRTGLTGEGLQELTTQMLNLARVAGGDVNALIASTTRVFGDWDIATEKQADTLDYLWKVSQNTGIGVDSLAQKVVQYGAPMRQMGFDFETTAALMGKFEKEGVNLELVMGSLRIALGNFAREGEEAPEALQRLITEIQGMESASEATALAMEIFGARAGPDMAAAIREGRFEVDELLAALDASGETVNAAAEETLTFAESMSMLKNEATIALETLGKVLLDLFQEFRPHLERGIELIKQVVEWFKNLDPETQKLIVVIAGLAAALGPVLVVLGTLIPVIAAIVSPVGLVVLAIVALIAAGVLLWKNWDTIKEKAVEIWGAVKTFFVDFWESIKDTFKAAIEAVVEWFKELPGRVWAYLTDLYNRADEWSNDLRDRIIEGAKSLVEGFINFMKELPYKLGFLLGSAIRAVIDWAGETKEWAETSGKDLLERFIEFVKNLPGQLWELLTDSINHVAKWTNEVREKATEAGKDLLNKFIEFVAQLPGKLWEWLTTTIQRVIQWRDEVRQRAIQAGNQIVTSFISVVRDLPNQLWGILVDAAKKLMSIGSTLWNNAKNAGARIWKGFKDGMGISSPSYLEKAMDAIARKSYEMRDEISSNFDNLSNIGFPDFPKSGGGGMLSFLREPGTAGAGAYDAGQIIYNGPLVAVENMTVRSERDIEDISRQLHRHIQASARARGGK